VSTPDEKVPVLVDGAAWLTAREEMVVRPVEAGVVTVAFPRSDAITGPLLAAVEAGLIKTVLVRCQCGRRLAHVLSDPGRTPGRTVIVVYRTAPDLLHQSALGRYARRRFPEQNPKAPDVTVGLCWLVSAAPATITTRCTWCKTGHDIDRGHLIRAHLRYSGQTITTTPNAIR